MSDGGLKKYILIANNIATNSSLYDPKLLLQTSLKWGFDLAVVDIYDFIRVFCAELSADEFKNAINTLNKFLSDHTLSGRPEFIRLFREAVNNWMQQPLEQATE